MSNDPYIHYMRTMDNESACGLRLTGPGQSMSTSTSDKLVNCPFCRIAMPTVKKSLTVGGTR